MPATFFVQIPWARLGDGQIDAMPVEAINLRDAFSEVAIKHPEFVSKVISEEGTHRGGSLIVINNDEVVRVPQILDTPLKDGDTIRVLFAIPGG